MQQLQPVLLIDDLGWRNPLPNAPGTLVKRGEMRKTPKCGEAFVHRRFLPLIYRVKEAACALVDHAWSIQFRFQPSCVRLSRCRWRGSACSPALSGLRAAPVRPPAGSDSPPAPITPRRDRATVSPYGGRSAK